MILLLILVLYILWRDSTHSVRPRPATDTSIGVLDRSPVPDRGRLRFLVSFILATYLLTVASVYLFWYRRTRLSPFHWFDDRLEWNQLDKSGHIYGAYFQTLAGYELLRWHGMDNKRAAIISAIMGTATQSSIELMDGFSSKWGASYSDICANIIGASLAAVQFLLWEEQRIQLKYSYEGGEYPSGELADRAADLFGTGFFERRLKDYNKMTLWASVNPSKFIPGIAPKWMNIAVGYGVDNLYGGFENKWIDKQGKPHDRTDIPRMRILNLSLDADLPQLSTGNKAELGILKILNVFKVPFPCLQHRWEANHVKGPDSDSDPG